MSTGARPSLRLIPAKTRVPLAPPGLVVRPRLTLALRRGIEKRLTLLTAPAGFGKTTILAEVARQLDGAAAWLTLDSSDTDLPVFVQYLVEAISRVRPGFGRDTHTWIEQTPNLRAQVDDLARTFLSELEDAAQSPLNIFLDDFHEIQGSETINRFLDTVLRYLPPAVSVVIGSRTPPSLVVTRLLVQQQVSGMNANELRFSLEEIKEWLAQRGQEKRTGAARLLDLTDGWAAGMILLSSNERSLDEDKLNYEQPYAYLSMEVLEQQSPAIQQFLLRAAVLDYFTASVCRQVLQVEDAAELLREVHKRQLFLTASAVQGGTHYRLHQIFRDFLSERLRSSDPTEFERLHSRAADYFTTEGDFSQAMRHLTTIASWGRAADLAVRVSLGEIGVGRIELVERWLRDFPPAIKESHPELLLIETRLLAAQSDIGKATEVLAGAERFLLEAGDQRGYAEALALNGRLATASGDGRHMIELAKRSLSIIEADLPTQAQAAHVAAIGYAMIGSSHQSDEFFSQALAGFEQLGDTISAMNLANDWGYALILRDELAQATLQLERSLVYARNANNTRQQIMILGNLAAALQMQGQFDNADRNLIDAREMAQGIRWQRLEAEILLNQANNASDRELFDKALLLYQESAELAQDSAAAVHLAAIAGQARCLRQAGRYAEAERLARQGLRIAPKETVMFEVALCRLELGATLLALATGDALPHLREAYATLNEISRKREGARAGALLASALLAALDLSEARLVLAEAAAVAIESDTKAQFLQELATLHGLVLLRLGDPDGSYRDMLMRLIAIIGSEERHAAKVEGGFELVRGRPHLFEVYSLGQANVYRDGILVNRTDWQSNTAKELFFYFVEYPEGQRRELVQAALWPEHSEAKARNNFHTSLSRLRAALGMDIVLVEGSIYRLNPNLAFWHDGSAAQALIERAGASSYLSEARRLWADAASLLAGPYADEFSRDWAGARRQFWDERSKVALHWLANDAIREMRNNEAVAWAQRLRNLDPFEEAAHLLLMRAYAAQLNPTLVAQQYAELSHMMREEFSADPSREATQLYRQLLREATG